MGAAGNRWFFRIPSTGRDAPTASCSVLRYYFSSYDVLRTTQGPTIQGGSGSSMEIPPIAAYGSSVGMTVKVDRRDSKVAAAAGPCLICHPERVKRVEGSPTRNPSHQRKQTPALSPKRYTMSMVSQNRAAGGRCIAAGRWHAKAPPLPAAPCGVQGPRPLVGKGFSKGETTIGFAL